MPEDFDQEQLQAVLERAADGDEDAWRQVVNAYTPRVFGLIRAQCGDAILAEEITQSSFCTVAAKLESYTELGRFEPWLFRIAMNRLRDEKRRQSRQARPTEDEALQGMAGAAPPAEAAGADPAELAALRGAMEKLADEDRTILHMRHFGGLRFEQMAEVLEKPLGTVLARHHRALKKLRDLMGGGEDAE